MSKAKNFGLGAVVLFLSLVGFFIMLELRAKPGTRTPEFKAPLVRVQPVELVEKQILVESHGTIAPKTQSQLTAEVAGRIQSISPQFKAGGFFEANEILIQIDPFDLNQAVIMAESDLAKAELREAQVVAEARLAQQDWQALGQGEADPLTLYIPQQKEAHAATEAARARVEKAKRDLEKAAIRVPFSGRVREARVDVGQFVGVGTPLATVYALDKAEVRLPILDTDLAFLQDALHPSKRAKPLQVDFLAEFGGETQQWSGVIVRSEGELDAKTRLFHLVAEIENPFVPQSDRMALTPGLFVKAQIHGVVLDPVAVLPRAALWGEDQVLVVDSENHLTKRTVQVQRSDIREVVIGHGLESGEQVAISRLELVTDGMSVRIWDGSQEAK
ncbi:MAG: efflux RND transporter periplasmic adaptor subunit [Acidobacteria bacterium]|nr:efflux RND transporter periplasmic adaptor subunit [Acidobacteriota bacterium]